MFHKPAHKNLDFPPAQTINDIVKETELKMAWEDGWHHGFNHIDLVNPHPVGSENSLAWERGYARGYADWLEK